jgi:hypothetical protein
MTKSFNHILNFHRLTSNPSSTINFRWLTPTDNCLPYVFAARTTQHRKHMSRIRMCGHWSVTNTGYDADHIENASSVVRMRVYCPVVQHWTWRGPHRKHFFQYPLYCCVRVFLALLRIGFTRLSI